MLMFNSDGFTGFCLSNGSLPNDDGLRAMAKESLIESMGSEFFDDAFWRLTQVMSPEHGLEDDVSSV